MFRGLTSPRSKCGIINSPRRLVHHDLDRRVACLTEHVGASELEGVGELLARREHRPLSGGGEAGGGGEWRPGTTRDPAASRRVTAAD